MSRRKRTKGWRPGQEATERETGKARRAFMVEARRLRTLDPMLGVPAIGVALRHYAYELRDEAAKRGREWPWGALADSAAALEVCEQIGQEDWKREGKAA